MKKHNLTLLTGSAMKGKGIAELARALRLQVDVLRKAEAVAKKEEERLVRELLLKDSEQELQELQEQQSEENIESDDEEEDTDSDDGSEQQESDGKKRQQ